MACARSQAVYAIVAGLRAKDTATPVPKPRRCVCSAINAPGKKGSCMVSIDHSAWKPISSADRAMPGTSFNPTGGNAASKIMASLL
jgi:hypothetical protein